MSGSPEKPSADTSQAFAKEAVIGDEPLTLELTANELEAWLDQMDVEPEKPSQSIFSARSGIQDPLSKASPGEEALLDADEGRDAPSVEAQEAGQAESAEETCPLPQAVDAPADSPESGDALSVLPSPRKSRRQMERVRRRQKSYLQEQRDKKRWRVRLGRLKRVSKLGFVILWAVLLWDLTQSPLWNFDQPTYQVHHHQLILPEQLAPIVKPWVGKPLYQVDTGAIEQAIMQQFDVVAHVSVRRHMFPARLEIYLQEKTPWAEVYADESLNRPTHLVVSDGLIPLAPYRYEQVRVKHRVPVEKLVLPPHAVISQENLKRLRELAWQARQIHGMRLESIDARNLSLVVLHYAEAKVLLGRLNKAVPDRLVRLVALTPKIKELGSAIAAVDLRWEEQITFHTHGDQPLPVQIEETPEPTG